ncbi:protein adenylyltransferase SelO [Haloplanus rubicundus]|uniref:YdiU family protein n=1 Tax=Haloplanus rubicundus TaxID=1547898 RepID=A0A345EE80_9EURY|nr:YdiU family protein [Haloplanus rubicundus]AXG10502.1 YdiU family protein [Haloplanus rubicundus]
MVFSFDTTYKDLDSNLYSRVTPKSIANPKILVLNDRLCADLGLDITKLNAKILAGQDRLEEPIAQAYAGHQYGSFTVLGDGRAMILGEHVHDGNRYDIQLKGSGRTPYSGRGDGNATVSSMLREYLYSYAMQNLNIKTSRSLAVVETDEAVERRQTEPGATLVRVMNSHIRYGTFQYVAGQASDELRRFTDYVIDRHYPQLNEKDRTYLEFFDAVMQSSIEMVVDWLRVGFIHGVMNTDNMSIDGETFDYGPCAFMNYYDEETVFSSIDKHGRYAFGNQRPILRWNLERFAEALQPLCTQSALTYDEIEGKLDEFEDRFDAQYYTMMRRKLGINSDGEEELVDEFLEWLRKSNADYTNTFLELETPGTFDDPAFATAEFERLRNKLAAVGLDEELIQEANPRYIPRNYLVEEALDEYLETGDLSKFKRLLTVLENPYTSKDMGPQFQQPPPREFDAEYTTYCNT